MTRPPAPPADCDHCGRGIGARATHYVLTDLTPPIVLCSKCFGRAARGGSTAHADTYPDCRQGWHDMHDHGLTFATRAGLQLLLSRPSHLKEEDRR